MKRLYIFLAVFFLLLLLFGSFIKLHYFNKGEAVIFEVRNGQSAGSVAAELKEQGIIKSTTWFKIVLRLTSSATDLKAGKFVLRKNTSSEEVINGIKSGKNIFLAKLTVLEGWRSEEIAEMLAANNITNANDFLDIVRQENLEGYLFPSTYLFSENTPARKVVDEMLSQFNKNIRPLFKQYSTTLTEQQILTVASIVEREAVIHEERPRIAAVYLNRIKIGKRLEADPTVQYALGFNLDENRYWKKRLTYKDLRTASPYNTYRNGGIPPGPICNPSYQSVKAVLNPEVNDYLYFVADNTGGHAFSHTFNEHLANIKRIRGR